MRISDWSSDVCSSDLWKIAMRPGKPLMFGDLAGTPVLGLPGNPVSAVVCSLLFARPALNALLGLDVPAHPLEPMALGADLPANDRRQDYLRATVRSEEHTSELQSLMRISSAVFCLQKQHTDTL